MQEDFDLNLMNEKLEEVIDKVCEIQDVVETISDSLETCANDDKDSRHVLSVFKYVMPQIESSIDLLEDISMDVLRKKIAQ